MLNRVGYLNLYPALRELHGSSFSERSLAWNG